MTTRRRAVAPRGPELGRLVAGLCLLVLLVVGAAASALPFLFRSASLRSRIEQTVAALLKEETGLDVRFRIDRALWPPGITLTDVEVASSTPGKPFARVAEARVTLRPFALLSGRVVIDTIEVDGPEADVRLEDGALANLPLNLKPRTSEPKAKDVEPPFRVVAITNAKVALTHVEKGKELAAVQLAGIDVDVDVGGEGTPVYELRLQKARGVLRTSHVQANRWPVPTRFAKGLDAIPYQPITMVDDDVLCALSASVRITDAPTARIVELRRFELDARLDDDARPGTPPSCEPGASADDRVVSLRVEGLELDLPTDDEGAPGAVVASTTGALTTAAKKTSPKLALGPADGRVRVRVPAFAAYRYVPIDPLGGFLELDLEASASVDLDDPLPGVLRAQAKGRLEGHELRLSHFRFGSVLAGDVFLRPGLVLGSRELGVEYGGGHVTLSDIELGLAPVPGAKRQLPMKANVAVKDLGMPVLVKELGVTENAHVRWDFKDAIIKLDGHLDPLRLDGDLVAKTRNFELAQRPVEKPNPGHIIGLAPKTGGIADLTAKVAIRPDALVFDQIHAAFGGTRLDGRVHLGFDDRFEVDAKSNQVDLADASPLTKFALAGVGKLDLAIRGTFDSFKGKGSVSFGGFVFDQFGLGDIESARYEFSDEALIEVTALEAKRGESRYQVPSMRIDLGVPQGVVVDALSTSGNFALEDLYGIFKLTGDPRWEGIQGHAAYDARVRFVVGGPTDVCGDGRLDLDVQGKVLALDLWGERYVGGAADVSLTWLDFDGGGRGLDLDVHAATLKKKGGGTIVASGTVRRGGNLNLKVTGSGVAIEALSAMPATKIPVRGTIDAVAEVGGTFDTMRIVADVDLSPVQIADHTLERSRFRVVREPLSVLAQSPQPDAKGCYTGQKLEPFDLAKWSEDPLTGEYVLTGQLFGGEVLLDDFRLTDQRKRVARGKVKVNNLALAPLSLVRFESAAETLGEQTSSGPPVAITGTASADVELEAYPLDAWWNAVGKIEKLKVKATRGDAKIATIDPTPTITFGLAGIQVPTTTLALSFGDVPATILLSGSMDRSPGDVTPPTVAATIDVPAIPLAKLEDYLPKNIERAEGVARAKLKIGGTLDAPTWDGELAITNGAFAFRQISMPLVGVNGSIKVDPKRGVTIEKLSGELGGGTVEVTGGAGLKAGKLGDVDVKVKARDVHFRYGDGLSTTFGADLRATWTPPDGGLVEPAHVEGVVEIDTFLYEKRIGFGGLDAIKSTKRTEVEVYDPLRDLVTFDVEIRSRRGFRIRNNMVDASLAIGQGGLHVLGTNQRWGVIGDLYVVKGGTFKVRRHDFEIREGTLRFDDDTKVDPNIDVSAVTEYRRAGSAGSTAEWRVKLHAYGTKDDLKLELSSEPPLSQEDLILLLTIGMTKAESAQIGGNVAGGAGLDLLANVTGVNETLSQAIPVIDDFRFGTAYSLRTGRTEPQVTFGKRLTDALRASLTSGFGERREINAIIEWRLSRQFSLQGSYDNVNDVSSRSVGNVGVDLRYRLEFE